jgi:hypothetical protein
MGAALSIPLGDELLGTQPLWRHGVAALTVSAEEEDSPRAASPVSLQGQGTATFAMVPAGAGRLPALVIAHGVQVVILTPMNGA